MKKTGSAPGKIILTGEYAVVFGHPGIAVPAPLTLHASFEEDRSVNGIQITWKGIEGNDQWNTYLRNILNAIEHFRGGLLSGALTIRNALPLGKGMGSSTALIIAVSRCLLGENCEREAFAIEDKLNAGHSGIDFAVIWGGRPVTFIKGEDPKPIALPATLFDSAILIDTGAPHETTAELVAWMKEHQEEEGIQAALEAVGKCTNRLQKIVTLSTVEARQSFSGILRDHHRAQTALGVVPQKAQTLIREIEEAGGAAKVIGAGGRTGGGGMVLALHKNRKIPMEVAQTNSFPCYPLHYHS